MKTVLSHTPIPGVAGKVIASAVVLKEQPEVHGILLLFTDGTELSIDFYAPHVEAEIRHYRWSNGEAVSVESELPLDPLT
jgi:hypothetical protein